MPRASAVRRNAFTSIFLALAFAAAAPNSMLARAGDPDDSSVFAYVGWLMTRGYVPYRDVWDHKGPLLYYINWLGWRIAPASTLGIGLLQYAVYAFAFYLLIRLLSQSGLSAAGTAIVGLFSIAALAQWSQGGNMAETWALGAIAACHALMFSGLRTRIVWWHFAGAAAALAACFWIRPNMCFFPALALLALGHMQRVRRGFRAGFVGLAIAGGTASALSLLVLLPVLLGHATHDFVLAYFVYNSAYSRFASLGEHLDGAVGLALVSKGIVLAWLAVPGWVMLRRTRLDFPPLYRVLLMVSLPLEFLATAMSGRPYFHYLVPLWPTAFVLAGVAVHGIAISIWRPRWKIAVAAMLVLALGWESRRYVFFLRKATRIDLGEKTVAAYIDAHSSVRDRILPVGDVAAVAAALRSRREPAGRYIFQLAMVHQANPDAQTEQAQEAEAIRREQPRFIFSFPGEVGNLCGDADAYQTLAARDGYRYGLMRSVLTPELSADYQQIQSQSFGDACLYERK